jgi:hypothetical protein
MLVLVIFLFNGCKKDKDDGSNLNCDQLYANYTNALTAFLTTPSEATCNAFEDAVQDYLNGCAVLTPAQKQELQQALDENDCSEYNTGK